jgi:hypothetical protein
MMYPTHEILEFHSRGLIDTARAKEMLGLNDKPAPATPVYLSGEFVSGVVGGRERNTYLVVAVGPDKNSSGYGPGDGQLEIVQPRGGRASFSVQADEFRHATIDEIAEVRARK